MAMEQLDFTLRKLKRFYIYIYIYILFNIRFKFSSRLEFKP